MIYLYSNENQTRWDRGDFQVQLLVPGNPKPIGFCDGSDEDVAELRDRAEAEGAEGFDIVRKHLKTGRTIWTLQSGG